ncbi:MAG: ribosome biogenesis GTPase YlqF [Syntrophomonadaceae bacterium]|jgi:ribosome biogenesis GTPase A|nr:ribosome biogenesis GTPase YlqF [Bacillota bacterium]NLP23798.1 ribosome biogenesis GTPase YlqF [Syntrophomonadaceae bacterium]
MTINWYPGHMVKARRDIEENLKLVDIVLMLVDARAPLSCRNPDLEHLARHKKIILILNKNDLADPNATRSFLGILHAEGLNAVAVNSVKGQGVREVVEVIQKAYESQRQDLLRRGRRIRPVRLMVTGVPNVGKSTFLNSLVGKKMARTGPRPGLTRGKQWIRVREDMELMDTPGLLWPKIESEEQGLKLALLNIIGENAYEEYEVALYLLKVLRQQAPQIFQSYYKLEQTTEDDEQLLKEISVKRGHLVKGGQPDPEKTARQMISDFRAGNLGRITLDLMP